MKTNISMYITSNEKKFLLTKIKMQMILFQKFLDLKFW